MSAAGDRGALIIRTPHKKESQFTETAMYPTGSAKWPRQLETTLVAVSNTLQLCLGYGDKGIWYRVCGVWYSIYGRFYVTILQTMFSGIGPSSQNAGSVCLCGLWAAKFGLQGVGFRGASQCGSRLSEAMSSEVPLSF